MKKFLICLFIFIVTGIGSAFLGVPGDATFVVGGVCALLYLIFSRKKGKSTSSSQGTTVNPVGSGSSTPSNQTSKYTDYFDERNIPSHWVKARACDNGDHSGVTVSRGDATHCHACGLPFDGEWGDRGLFDGYFCQIHNKWIARGDHCIKCKNEGLIK